MQTVLEIPPQQVQAQPAKLSTKTAHLPALQESSVKLAESTGLTPAYVEIVASAALGNNIRASKKIDEAKTVLALSVELEFCAISYCGAAKTDELVYDEVVLFVMSRFGHLGIQEIREAFRLAAAGDFEVDLSTYYGLFTVKLMGDVLNGYNNYRNRVVQAFARSQSEKEADEKHQSRKDEFDWDFWAEQRLVKLRSLESPHYRCCTAFDYEYFLKTGELVFTEEEKLQAWKDSHQYAYAEVATNALSNFSARFQLDRVNQGKQDEGYKAKRIVIAQQLLVFRWLFPGQPENPTE